MSSVTSKIKIGNESKETYNQKRSLRSDACEERSMATHIGCANSAVPPPGAPLPEAAPQSQRRPGSVCAKKRALCAQHGCESR